MLSVDELVDRLIDLSFAEDIGDGDHTTLCCIPEDAMGKSHLLIKEDGILAGVEIAKEVFHRFDPTMQVEVLMQDGTRVKKGDIAMIVSGKIRSLLQTERLMLNIMQRMSGIATMTDKYVKSGDFSDFSPELNLGYAYFLTGKLTVEPEVFYEHSTKSSDYSGFGVRIGFGVYF